jgi:hypothetical protein
LLIRLKAEHRCLTRQKRTPSRLGIHGLAKLLTTIARSELTERVLQAAFTKDAQAAEATGQSAYVDGALLAQLRKDGIA